MNGCDVRSGSGRRVSLRLGSMKSTQRKGRPKQALLAVGRVGIKQQLHRSKERLEDSTD